MNNLTTKPETLTQNYESLTTNRGELIVISNVNNLRLARSTNPKQTRTEKAASNPETALFSQESVSHFIYSRWRW